MRGECCGIDCGRNSIPKGRLSQRQWSIVLRHSRLEPQPDLCWHVPHLCGYGVAALSSRVLVLVLPIAIAMSYGVVAREEPYLERRFGHAYRDYKARVRRWLQSLDERVGSIRAEVAVRATIAIADAACVGPAR